MSLTNPNTPVSQQDLQDFYHKILPYMGGGSGGGGGHTIEDSAGTDLTQRATLQFGEGFLAEDDDTNEKTVISPDVMQSGDMDDVITPLPSVAPKKEGIKYSTTEQVIGEWIDSKPLYQIVIALPSNISSGKQATTIDSTEVLNIDTLIYGTGIGYIYDGNSSPMGQMLINGYFEASTYYSFSSAIKMNSTGTKVVLSTNVTASGYTLRDVKIILQYTKTTDTPNT